VGEFLSLDPSNLAFAFAAGASAFLSPCGYPMLPGYISYYMGTELSSVKALYTGLTCTLGLITTFSIIGAIASIVGNVINPYIPLLELVAGVTTILFGVTMLFEINLPFMLALKAPKRKGFIGIYLYGIIYGLATLGCSAPIFFATLFWAIVQSGPLNGLITFLVYSIGMGVPLIVTSILVSLVKKRILKRLTKMTPKIQKFSGTILVIIGVYLIYYYYAFL
jgi:cytochrome c biogenesis protein CcdA